MAEALLAGLDRNGAIIRKSLAGSLRRCNEIVKDIDIVCSSSDPAGTAEFFASLPLVERIRGRGETKVSVALASGINADLRIVSDAEFPFALHHFTGSKEHNVALRGRAGRMGLKMNEYGIFREAGTPNSIACTTEEEIFATFGLALIPPEIRENMGEIEAAESNSLPHLIDMSDIRGVFHVHTDNSDGRSPLTELVNYAKSMGL